MRNIIDALPPEQQKDPVAQSRRIAQAYAALFSGNGGKLDAELVLVDLAIYTRYYDTAMITMPAEQVARLDAKRSVFQRVLEALTLAAEEPRGLHAAVLAAPPIDNVEETQE
jgi:hypothetical protein